MTSRGFLVKGLLAAALVFAVVAGIAALGERLGGADDSPVPATKKSVAAVAVEVLGIRPTSYDVNPRYDVPDPLGVEIRFKPPGDDGDSHYLYVSVNRYGVDDPSVCSEHYDCADWDGAGGSFHLAWQEEQPEEDPGILTLTFTTDHGERRSVTYAGNLIEGDPRDQDLPLSVEGDLVRLLTDDRLSATTTRDMVDTDLPKWPKDDTRGDAVPTTPAIVAQWMVENGARETAVKRPADTTAYGDGAVGAELVGKDHTTSVVLVPRGDPRVPTCGVGWNCETKRGVVRGWRPGVAIAIRETQDAVMLLTVRSDAIDALPRMRSRFGTAGEDYLALAVDWGAFNLQTTKEFADDVPPW